ncbi:MAG: heptosyltransferase-3, partial [Candidatus Omnitrophota bacterium]
PFKKLLVMRMDHIGDVVVAEHFLTQYKANHPSTEIVFLTSQVGKLIFAELLNGPDSTLGSIEVFDAPWFKLDYGQKESWLAWKELRRTIRGIKPDCIIDLRGDLRHITAARLGAWGAWIESYGISGGRFLLNAEVSYAYHAHAARRNLNYLVAPLRKSPQVLDRRIASTPLKPSLVSELVKINSPIIAMHPGAGTPAKQWPIVYWRELTAWILSETRAHIIWVGDKDADLIREQIMINVAPEDQRRFMNLCADLPIDQLGSLFEDVDMLISADSGPVHIGAIHQTKTIVIFSGTAHADEWRPLNPNAQLVEHEVECSPCSERRCPKAHHACMLDLKPKLIIEAVKQSLNSEISHGNNHEQS